jgi:hypothetical protein
MKGASTLFIGIVVLIMVVMQSCEIVRTSFLGTAQVDPIELTSDLLGGIMKVSGDSDANVIDWGIAFRSLIKLDPKWSTL